MKLRQALQISVSDITMKRIDRLIELLPKKVVNGKSQRIYNSHIIELYSEIIHTYFDLDQLSAEYKLLNIIDGRRKEIK